MRVLEKGRTKTRFGTRIRRRQKKAVLFPLSQRTTISKSTYSSSLLSWEAFRFWRTPSAWTFRSEMYCQKRFTAASHWVGVATCCRTARPLQPVKERNRDFSCSVRGCSNRPWWINTQAFTCDDGQSEDDSYGLHVGSWTPLREKNSTMNVEWSQMYESGEAWSEGWGTNTHLRCWVAPVLLQWMTEGFYRVQEEREEAACNRKGVCACDVIGCLQRSSVSCGACCANSRSKFSTVFHRVKRSTEQGKGVTSDVLCQSLMMTPSLFVFVLFFSAFHTVAQ